MNKYLLYNDTSDEHIGKSISLANTFFKRLKGLLGTSNLTEDEGLIIYPCNMVHTIGMKINIDVLFLSADHVIIYIIENMGTKKISPVVKKARYVIELKAGSVTRKGIKIGDKLSWRSCTI